MVALTFVLRRVLEQIGYIPLWNINVRQNLILWLVALYPYLNIQEHIQIYFIALKHKSVCSFFYRTRTPPIRVTYFSDFVNRFLKNIFEKIL